MYNVRMKKTCRLDMRASEKMVKGLDLIISRKPGIRTRAAAIEFCVETILMEIEKEDIAAGRK